MCSIIDPIMVSRPHALSDQRGGLRRLVHKELGIHLDTMALLAGDERGSDAEDVDAAQAHQKRGALVRLPLGQDVNALEVARATSKSQQRASSRHISSYSSPALAL